MKTQTNVSQWPQSGAAVPPPAPPKTSVNPPNVTSPEEDIWPRREEEPKSKRDRQNGKTAKAASWLDGDPFNWIGKRIRSKKTGAIFTVRGALRSGRIEVEKNWMSYTYDIETIRTDFETYS